MDPKVKKARERETIELAKPTGVAPDVAERRAVETIELTKDMGPAHKSERHETPAGETVAVTPFGTVPPAPADSEAPGSKDLEGAPVPPIHAMKITTF